MRLIVRLFPLAGLAFAGYLVITSTSLAWGGADAPDGTRFKVSPIRVSHVLEPHQTVSTTENCRVHRSAGDIPDCPVAPGGGSAYARYRLVYPLALGIAGLCWLAGVMVLLNRRTWAAMAALSAALLVWGAMIVFSTAAGPGVAWIAALPFGLAATLGTMKLLLAAGLALSAAAFLVKPVVRAAGLSWATLLCLVLPFAGLRFGGWTGTGIGFALGIVLLGVAVQGRRREFEIAA